MVCHIYHHIGIIVSVIILRKGTAWSDGFWEHMWHHAKQGWMLQDGTRKSEHGLPMGNAAACWSVWPVATGDTGHQGKA
jgi:hypothetical protein